MNLQIIGGNVEKLVEKWRIERGGGEKTAKTASLAPKWIPFGKKAKQVQQLDKNFKANQVLPKNEIDETTDFAKNREEVLKNLGDDKKDQKVFSRPNVEVPLPQIQKTVPQNKPKKNTEDNNINKKKQRRGRKNSEDDDTPLPDYVKPGAAPTLFDFIGATTGLEDEIKNIQITRQQNTPRGNRSEPQNFSSGNRNSHGPREKQENPRGNFGNNPRKKRNDQRTSTSGNSENPTSSGFRGNRNDGLGKPNNFQENRQQQQKFPEKKREDQQRGNSSRVENNQQNRNNKAQNYQHQDKYPNRNQNFASNQGSGRSDVAGNQGNRQQGNRQQQQQYGNQQNRDVSNRNTQNQRVAQSHHQPAQSTFNPNQQPPRPSVWQIGSQCMAPWEDGRIYPAQIMNILPNGTCVIRYTEYGNITEIPLDFLMYC
ncbi:unnamed protein product [Caenorhabditis angaria]|uniref:Tudor domain-containing protein n=1 Tax=Caenorhabditis angaria TaxID=860376 RepID=A0A9P1N5U3_9PELO|nr:unnamed protein product [Caenorhabditis angaria]